LPADHPASAQAQEAPRSGIKRLVTTDELTAKTKAQLAREEVPNPDFQNSGMSPDTGNMPGMDMSKPAGAGSPKTGTTPGMDASQMKNMEPAPASSPATKEATEIDMKKTSDEMKKTSDELKAKSDETQRAESVGGKSQGSSSPSIIYTCVMHPEVQQPAPGKCPKCGMTLVKKGPAAP
jgi:hypothetical protein